MCASGSCLCKPCQSHSQSHRYQTPTMHPPVHTPPLHSPALRGAQCTTHCTDHTAGAMGAHTDKATAKPCTCSLQPDCTKVSWAASSLTCLVPRGLRWQVHVTLLHVTAARQWSTAPHMMRHVGQLVRGCQAGDQQNVGSGQPGSTLGSPCTLMPVAGAHPTWGPQQKPFKCWQ